MSRLVDASKRVFSVVGNALYSATGSKTSEEDVVPRDSEDHNPTPSDNHLRTLADVSLLQPLRTPMLGPGGRSTRKPVTRSKLRGERLQLHRPEKLLQEIDPDNNYEIKDAIEV